MTTVTSSASTRFFELLARVVLSVTDAGDGQSRLLHIIISDSKPPAPTLFFQVLTTIVSAFKIRECSTRDPPVFRGIVFLGYLEKRVPNPKVNFRGELFVC